MHDYSIRILYCNPQVLTCVSINTYKSAFNDLLKNLVNFPSYLFAKCQHNPGILIPRIMLRLL